MFVSSSTLIHFCFKGTSQRKIAEEYIRRKIYIYIYISYMLYATAPLRNSGIPHLHKDQLLRVVWDSVFPHIVDSKAAVGVTRSDPPPRTRKQSGHTPFLCTTPSNTDPPWNSLLPPGPHPTYAQRHTHTNTPTQKTNKTNKQKTHTRKRCS